MPNRALARDPSEPAWCFLTNHSHVLLCLARDPELRLRDVAERVGITERAVQRIVSELEDAGYITRSRNGRRNLYEVHPDRPLRHPIESHRDVSSLLDLVLRDD
jgi:predicted transcriptional regulator